MNKKIAGLLGTVAGFATLTGAQASVPPANTGPGIPQASSYAELLGSVPNASDVVKADDLARAAAPTAGNGGVKLAQFSVWFGRGRRYHHHHHHHHHHNYRYR